MASPWPRIFEKIPMYVKACGLYPASPRGQVVKETGGQRVLLSGELETSVQTFMTV